MSRRACFALVLAALLAGPAVGQPAAKPPVIPFDGTEVFCYLLKARKFTPIPSLEALAAPPPHETVVIVFGQNHVLTEIRQALGGWKVFLRDGGSVLIATDFADRGRLAPFGVAVSGNPVLQLDPGGYKGEPACPLLTEFTAANPALFEGLKGHGLATNRPSLLATRLGGLLRPLATYPADCVMLRQGRPEVVFGDHDHPYIAGTPFDAKSAGRAVVLAGHGIFTNGMLLQQDNDNFDFTVNCLRWLREGPDGTPRRHALFVVDGQVIPSFDVGLKPPAPPIPTPTVALVNQLLTGIEREGFVIRLLEDNFDVHRSSQITLLAFTVLALLYGAKKLAEVRHHAEGASVAIAGPYARAADTTPLARQRGRSQAERDGLWEEARALSRQGLLELAGVAPAHWNADSAAGPRFDVAGGWLAQLRLRRDVDRVLRIAERREPIRFTWAELVRLTQSLAAMRQAAQEGRLRFRR